MAYFLSSVTVKRVDDDDDDDFFPELPNSWWVGVLFGSSNVKHKNNTGHSPPSPFHVLKIKDSFNVKHSLFFLLFHGLDSNAFERRQQQKTFTDLLMHWMTS